MFILRRRAALALVTSAVLAGGLMAVASAGQAAAATATVTAIEAQLPANAGSNPALTLYSLSCASVGNCTLAGRYTDSSGNIQGLLLTETNGTWARGIEARLPKNARTDPAGGVFSVSCASAGKCSAVGTYDNRSGTLEGLLLTETKGTWGRGIEAPLPKGDTASQALSVSCASAGNCTAIGDATSPVSSINLGTGVLWTQTKGHWATGIPAPMPANAAAGTEDIFGIADQVSCSSPGNCTVIGSYATSQGLQGLLLTQTNGRWATGVEASVPTDALTNDPGVSLNSVSCSSPGNCTAVGTYTAATVVFNHEGLLLTENNGTWAPGVKASPPASTDTYPDVSLGSVSCSSAGNCTAAGDDDGQGLLLTQTSGTWATGIAAPVPANAADGAGLGQVSCPSAGNCTAVGFFRDSSFTPHGMLLTESSGTWATGIQAPLPANANVVDGDGVGAVSCPSAGNCTAVGSYTDTSGHAQGLLLTISTP